MLTRTLNLPPTPENNRNSEGTFVTLKSGRVLLAYCKFGPSKSDHGPAVICSRYSDDQGLTWSTDDRLLVPMEGDTNVMCPSFLRLHDGRIALFNLRKDRTGIDDTYFSSIWVRYSSDEAQTFSPPQRIIRSPAYFNVNNDRIIQLSSGRIVVPICMHPYRTQSYLPEGQSSPQVVYNPSALVSTLFSDDSKNWFESTNQCFVSLPNGRGLQEPGFVELSDGRLLMWARCGIPPGPEGTMSHQYHAHSTDQGLTWSTAKPWKHFVSPTSPMSLKRIPGTSTLLAIWNDRSIRWNLGAPAKIAKFRTPLASAISTNDGKTWKKHKLLEPDPNHGYCYTAIEFLGDHVLLAYCSGGITTAGILDRLTVSRIPLADLLA
jgi:sialidase-1